ncbi:carboxylesterase family protein [Pararobbsia silviterrae]|uniref:Carboxylic ester hydrolase n=2 Tax=Pararobbsia silviterrae TaxID=1792498 RepID=A0A494XSY8_9BURK|nr:carboxylesterase family protein [Pararobbsia silviterrae]
MFSKGALFGLLVAALSAHADTNVVTTQSGRVAGSTDDGVESFKGIPYAQPPIGALRWRAPQPVHPWQGVKQATAYGKDCLQEPFPGDAAPLGVGLSENCLFVNVWRPAQAQAAKRPVMVWIYGGGFVNGGSSPGVYSGSEFAKQGIVFVSFNYRVGRFGFFAHPSLTAANADHGLLGNYGLMDQIAALKWVQANIEQFGGDPKNVTIFGESAGGFSVASLLTSTLTDGLFNRAIIESGSGRHNITPGLTLKQAEDSGVAFATANHIDGTGEQALDKLRKLPAAKVVNGLNMATMRVPTYAGPMIDGTLVTGEPQDVYQTGAFHKVPLIVGANGADLGFPPKAATLDDALAPLGAAKKEAARAAYDPNGTAKPDDVAMMIASDQFMAEPARFVARTFSAAGAPTWEYRFGYVADSMKKQWPGAVHASEIPYAFNTLEARYDGDVTADDLAVANQMHAYWVNFAKHGDPNGEGLPQWTRYSAEHDNVLWFASEGAAQTREVADPWKTRLDLVMP